MLRVSKDALLILALVAMVAQFVAFSNVSHAIAGPINYGLDFSKQIFNVFVTNDNAHPVPVAVQGTVAVQGPVDASAVDSSASQAFQGYLGFYWENGNELSPANTTTFTVPAGKRLIIRNVSGIADLPIGQQLLFNGILTTIGNSQAGHYFPTSFGGTLGAESDYYQFGQETWIVADGGTTVYPVALRSSGTNPDNLARGVSIEVTGYLIDVSP